jgi:hypothetical protein
LTIAAEDYRIHVNRRHDMVRVATAMTSVD